MTTLNSAQRAADKIISFVYGPFAAKIHPLTRDLETEQITAIIEEETRVKEKEEALKDCIKWIKIVVADKPNKTTRKLIWEAQAALAEMPKAALGDKPDSPNKQG